MPAWDNAIGVLQTQLAGDPELAGKLTTNLRSARILAEGSLRPDLFQALSWPSTPEEYLAYLGTMATTIPSEDQSVDTWKLDGYSAEVFDRLCHFYWLLDPQTDAAHKGLKVYDLQSYEKGDFSFADWIVAYNNEWGAFLNDPASLTPESLASFKAVEPYHVGDSSDYEAQWTCFNDFFSRQLNPGLRPVADPTLNTTITSPADCTYKQDYAIDEEGNVESVTLKKTHTIGSVEDLLAGSDYAEDFEGGTFVHYFLSPYDYHRFHAPVSGRCLECRPIQAQNYLAVQLKDGQFDAPDSSKDGYEFNQARGILVIDTNTVSDPAQRIGKVAVVPIGMAQVSSVHMTAPEGMPIEKGAEFGHFAFGGSDIILLFEKNPNLYLRRNDDMGQPIHFLEGQASAYWQGKPAP